MIEKASERFPMSGEDSPMIQDFSTYFGTSVLVPVSYWADSSPVHRVRRGDLNLNSLTSFLVRSAFLFPEHRLTDPEILPAFYPASHPVSFTAPPETRLVGRALLLPALNRL